MGLRLCELYSLTKCMWRYICTLSSEHRHWTDNAKWNDDEKRERENSTWNGTGAIMFCKFNAYMHCIAHIYYSIGCRYRCKRLNKHRTPEWNWQCNQWIQITNNISDVIAHFAIKWSNTNHCCSENGSSAIWRWNIKIEWILKIANGFGCHIENLHLVPKKRRKQLYSAQRSELMWSEMTQSPRKLLEIARVFSGKFGWQKTINTWHWFFLIFHQNDSKIKDSLYLIAFSVYRLQHS